MLNGLHPVVLFQFKKIIPDLTAMPSNGKMPVVAGEPSWYPLPFIPIYLGEDLTGIFDDSVSKSMDLGTDIEATTDGTDPDASQRVLASTVTLQMKAPSGSLGVLIFSALADIILPKVASKEYSITLLYGAVTVFNGLLQSLVVSQGESNDMYNITLAISQPRPAKTKTEETTRQAPVVGRSGTEVVIQ